MVLWIGLALAAVALFAHSLRSAETYLYASGQVAVDQLARIAF